MALLSHDVFDMPMSLGDHLHELRKRLIVPVAMLAVLFIAAFSFQNQLKVIFLNPLLWGVLINPELSIQAGLPVDPLTKMLTTTKILISLDMSESAMISMSVSFYAALYVTIPIMVYQIWKFVSVGLMSNERRLAFLFVPAGIIFFYLGSLAGYFWGLPYYYAWLIEWAAHDQTTHLTIRQNSYHDSFILMTICFGLLADIPWLVMVLVRVGFVTPDGLAKKRKFVILVNTVIAGLITPPDGASMLIMMVPLQLLFELGLLLSRGMLAYNAYRERIEAAKPVKDDHQDDHHG
jgi:sec-independent protein translocase protein TatC